MYNVAKAMFLNDWSDIGMVTKEQAEAGHRFIDKMIEDFRVQCASDEIARKKKQGKDGLQASIKLLKSIGMSDAEILENVDACLKLEE